MHSTEMKTHFRLVVRLRSHIKKKVFTSLITIDIEETDLVDFETILHQKYCRSKYSKNRTLVREDRSFSKSYREIIFKPQNWNKIDFEVWLFLKAAIEINEVFLQITKKNNFLNMLLDYDKT